jgi:N-acetyl-alpha-D-muramate 1-phosphate uridylyltransferase
LTRAIVLAAGRGERMRPLSDHTPKPLLPAGGRMLIEWQIAALAEAGIRELVINTAHRAAMIEQALGSGARLGVRIDYSREGEQAQDALETLGGIVRALPLLGEEPFLVVSGDIVSDYDFRALRGPCESIASGRRDAHFVLVDNPPYHPDGDMGMEGEMATMQAPRLTYANIGVFAPRVFAGLSAHREPLFPWAFELVRRGRVSAERFSGRWCNIGTPAHLQALDLQLRERPLRHRPR